MKGSLICFFSSYIYSISNLNSKLFKISFLTCAIFFCTGKSFSSYAQVPSSSSGEAVLINSVRGVYRLIERTDLRRYDNGVYSGLLSKIVTSAIAPDGVDATGQSFSGNFWVDMATKLSNVIVSDSSRAIPAKFSIAPNGAMSMEVDNGYPTFRAFPSFPNSPIKIGDKWMAEAIRVVDPKDNGSFTHLPFLAEYTYKGIEKFRGSPVHSLSAEWATRYGLSYKDPNGDPTLIKAAGSHKATMFISCDTGAALVIRDSVNEEFFYQDGSTVSYKGTISLFTEYPPAHDTTPVERALINRGLLAQEAATQKPKESKKEKSAIGDKAPTPSNFDKKSDKVTKVSEDTSPLQNKITEDKISTTQNSTSPSIDAKKTDLGLLLTINNLHFKSNEAILLDSDKALIKDLAAALKEADTTQKFLIEGHTASTGRPRAEEELSFERAKNIAELLSAEGISKSRFILKGSGSRKPVAPNTTSDGMARNRRVEITILD